MNDRPVDAIVRERRYRHSVGWMVRSACLVAAVAAFVQPLAAQENAIALSEADYLIRTIFSTEDTAHYARGAALYLMRLAEPGHTADDRRTFLEYFRTAAMVMPELERPAALTDRNEYEDLKVAGQSVANWWRRQDPFPATPRNERVEEHLARVGYAAEQFRPSDGDGIDVRGEVFVRLGPPALRKSIRLNESVRVFDLASTSPVPELADNELWVYRHVHDEAYYFFMRDSRLADFREAHPSELIPSRLREGIDARTDRGRERASALLLVMEEVYAQLALAHPIFGSTHDRIAHFRGRPPTHTERPNHVARSTLAAATSIETESAGRRSAVVPSGYSQLHELIEELPVESRWARFLEPDGSTRTEIYWSVDPQALQPSRHLVRTLTNAGFTESDEYLLAASVTRYAPNYEFRDVDAKYYRVRPRADRLPVQTFTVRGDTGAYSLAMQWAEHWLLTTPDGAMGEGAVLKLATARTDTLRALRGDGLSLEMSDLKPVYRARDVPFPFLRLHRADPPDLVFEIYNLNFDSDDRAHYSIEYEVAREAARRTTATRSRTSATTSGRNADERIALDLSDWTDDGTIRVTVRVTDEVTQQSTSRSISFESDK